MQAKYALQKKSWYLPEDNCICAQLLRQERQHWLCHPVAHGVHDDVEMDCTFTSELSVIVRKQVNSFGRYSKIVNDATIVPQLWLKLMLEGIAACVIVVKRTRY
jgi:hypothetical protein